METRSALPAKIHNDVTIRVYILPIIGWAQYSGKYSNCLSGAFCFAVTCVLHPALCLNGDTVQRRVRVCECVSEDKPARHFNPTQVGRPQKRPSWKSPAADVIVLWLLPYLGRLNIPLDCVACQPLWPRYLPPLSFRNAPAQPNLNTACVYTSLVKHWPPLIHSGIILKQITFSRQGRGTMKILDPAAPRRSWWRRRAIWAGLAAECFMETHIRVGRRTGSYWMSVWPPKSVEWMMEPTSSAKLPPVNVICN